MISIGLSDILQATRHPSRWMFSQPRYRWAHRQACDAERPFFKPDASSEVFPAVVALHGCDGMYGRLPGREERLSARHQAMADLLLAEGYAVLFPDSFNPRGRRELCMLPAREQPITPDQRRLDVLGALDYLRSRPDIAHERIALLGWSHGASAVLAAMNARHPVVAAYLARLREPGEFYLTAIAFYPGCSLRAREGYAPAAPIRIFIGESDDWTSPRACTMLAKAMEGMDEPLHVTTYPDTYHGFDAPRLPKQHLDLLARRHAQSGTSSAASTSRQCVLAACCLPLVPCVRAGRDDVERAFARC